MNFNTEINEVPNVVTTTELLPGGMIELNSQMPYHKMVFGRSPSIEHSDAPNSVPMTKDIMPVKLVGAGNDTSRQHFGIAKDDAGPFVVENYSRVPLKVNDFLGVKHIVTPGGFLSVARDSMDMQRVSIAWGNGYEVSVQSVSGGTDKSKWSVGFTWNFPKI